MSHSKTIQEEVGQGTWFSMHILGLNANTEEGKNTFIFFMNLLKVYFPCPECRGHINEYLSNNPIPKIYDTETGYFKYTWEFHNTVNGRLNKPIMNYEVALKLYRDMKDSECDGRCGAISTDHSIVKTSNNNNKVVYNLNKTNNQYSVRQINFVRSNNF